MQQVYHFSPLLRTRWTWLQVWKHPKNTLTLVWKYFISIVSQKGSELLHRTIRLNVKLVCQSNSNPPCWRKKKNIYVSTKTACRVQLEQLKSTETSEVCTQAARSKYEPLRTSLQTTWPRTDVSPRDRREPGLVQHGQVWHGPDWKEEGAGNTGNDPVCSWKMMCRTFVDLPVQITPYHSCLSGWSGSKRVRPAGCPGGNEVIGTDRVE